ncbi:recombination mediator RecR [Reinekea marina]|uniref:Recombination protein RecR n=1 Tax=Reinekea marina TaxID=1310421 RepID=A0ABV7WU60_9GAMM|nr:recombination mediator RecR [Reinekea marina]MDN3649794.1 recombination mediator RecR [Reinekea marina]
MSYTPSTESLIKALQILPGIGVRSAQRLALHLLERAPDDAKSLNHALSDALSKVKKCPSCRTLTESPLCEICTDEARDSTVLCVVISDADKEGLELSGHFNGRYFVLHGVLSPIDGIGPEQLGIWQLVDKLTAADNSVTEVLLALDDQMESDATAYFINEQLKKLKIECARVRFSQFKSGTLDKADSRIIADAFANKQSLGFEHD